jgi:hypothetical protein
MQGRKTDELAGISLLGRQKHKYAMDYEPQVLEAFAKNILIMTIL